jgi:hypothetical protein
MNAMRLSKPVIQCYHVVECVLIYVVLANLRILSSWPKGFLTLNIYLYLPRPTRSIYTRRDI